MSEPNDTGTNEPGDDDLLCIFVGPVHAHYFAEAFRGFAEGGSVKWNWPALFATLPWLLYRKLWLYSFAYAFSIPMVLIAIGFAAIFVVDRELGYLVYYVLYFVVGVVLAPMFVTRLYYGHARKKIANIKARTQAGEEQRLEIARAGSTSVIGIVVSAFVMAVPLIGIFAAISIPAYHDMGVRGQVAEGLNVSMRAKVAVAEYFSENNEFPADNITAGLPPPDEISGRHVSSVRVDTGSVVVTYGYEADRRIRGKTLVLQPEISDRIISWMCFSPDIGGKHLPAACR